MKFKSLPIFALMTLFALVSLSIFAVASGREFIGYRHKGVVYGKTLPNGVKDLGGGLLSDENYGVTRFSKSKKYMLWLEKIVERDREGVPSWEVKDVLAFDKPKKNQEYLFSHSSMCRQNDRQNLDLIVLAEFAPKTKTYKVLDAWRANVKRGKFEKTSLKDIDCVFTARSDTKP